MSDSFRTHDGRTLQQAASDLVQREVLCCMSSMVATLAQGHEITAHKLGSMFDLPGLCEQAAELSAPVLDYEEAAREAGWKHGGDNGGFWYDGNEFDSWKAAASADEAPTYETAQQLCEDRDIEPHEHEVFGHWAVSTWFAEKLTAVGERVDTDFAGLCVWARTRPGRQSRLMP